VSDAKGQLTELVRRAEVGEEVILIRHGHAAVRLVAVNSLLQARIDLLPAVRAAAKRTVAPGPDAARSQDELYGDDGMPR
jgi:antitoxin (DNA-binding transcriptional repressor) of toxin-antitoxin stability system